MSGGFPSQGSIQVKLAFLDTDDPFVTLTEVHCSCSLWNYIMRGKIQRKIAKKCCSLGSTCVFLKEFQANRLYSIMTGIAEGPKIWRGGKLKLVLVLTFIFWCDSVRKSRRQQNSQNAGRSFPLGRNNEYTKSVKETLVQFFSIYYIIKKKN